jgi:hypothetical protein
VANPDALLDTRIQDAAHSEDASPRAPELPKSPGESGLTRTFALPSDSGATNISLAAADPAELLLIGVVG